jgi:DNA-directed RNA polymerase subunit RPC12/RpoP
MTRSTYFVQECPTCGRNLQVRVQYLGKQVVCQHCGARFEACDPSSGAYPPPSSSLSLLERAEQLLQTTAAAGIGSSGLGAPVLMSDVAPLPVRPK